VAFETMGCPSTSTHDFLCDLGKRISKINGDIRSGDFLLQRLSIAIQRGNAAAVFGSMPEDSIDDNGRKRYFGLSYIYITYLVKNCYEFNYIK